MKKLCLLIVCFLTIDCIIVDGQYRINKTRYDYHNYVYQPGDPYNPGTASVASLLIPGLGQMISGEPGRGFVFLAGCAGFLTVSIVGGGMALTATERDPDFYEKTNKGIILLFSGLAGAGITWIWSITDASRVAKVNNMALRAQKNKSGTLTIQPLIGFPSHQVNNKAMVGLSLNINFHPY